tara:strand:+ start:582 stop:1094 length:513 start_codon:yes stop_codon:yes gene_type:complete
MTHTYQFEQITRKDCEAMGGNIPWKVSKERLFRLDRNPQARKPWWFYLVFEGKERISIINGTPLLDDEGNPIEARDNPHPPEACAACVVRKGTPTPLVILIRREERSIRRAEMRSMRRVVAKQRPTFNAVPEDIVWHMHRRGKTLDTWSLQVLKSQNRDTLKSLSKAGVK